VRVPFDYYNLNVTDPGTPRTNNDQNSVWRNSVVSDLQVNESDVVWYTASSAGEALAPTAALTSGSYYGPFKIQLGCESAIRLLVTVSVTDPGTPTTNNTTQNFCLENNPKVSDIQVNES
jgi:hypothetical protein